MERFLSELAVGGSGEVTRVCGSGALQRRLLDMGVVRGTAVEVTRVAPFGDPVEIKLKGYQLSLRREEAALVAVEVGDV